MQEIEYIENPGQVIAIIGQAASGPVMEPIYALDRKHVVRNFTKGELVEAYKATFENGGKNIYLIRVDYATDREKFFNYIYAYEALQALSVDVIVPLDFNLDDYIVDFPDLFVKEEEVEIKKGKTEYSLSRKIEDVEYIKYRGSRVKKYEIKDDYTLKLNFMPSVESENFVVKYYGAPVVDVNFIISGYRGNIKQREVRETFEFDINQGVRQTSEKSIVDFLALDEEEKQYYSGNQWNYTVTTDNDFISIYYSQSGQGKIHFTFNYDRYIQSNQEIKYFVEELAKHCSYLKNIALVRADDVEGNLISAINNVKERLNSQEIEFARSIVATPSVIEYNDYRGTATVVLAGLCGSYQSHQAITNKAINSNCRIVTQYSDNERRKLSDKGYTILYSTIRNGKVPYRALTLAEENNPYRYLKVARTMKELAKRVLKVTDRYTGYSIEYALDEIGGDVVDVLRNMTVEDKIVGGSFELDQVDDNKIKIDMYIGIEGEVQNINSTVIADMFAEGNYLGD